MSFGAAINGGRLQYALRNFDSLFAQHGNLFSPAFLRMCRDTVISTHAARLVEDPDLTIAELL